MKMVKVEELKPDMILAKPVTAREGQVLAGKGMVLSESIIEQLLRRRVNSLWVETDEEATPDLSPEMIEKKIEEIRKELDARFQLTCRNSNMIQLKEIILSHSIRKAGLLVDSG